MSSTSFIRGQYRHSSTGIRFGSGYQQHRYPLTRRVRQNTQCLIARAADRQVIGLRHLQQPCYSAGDADDVADSEHAGRPHRKGQRRQGGVRVALQRFRRSIRSRCKTCDGGKSCLETRCERHYEHRTGTLTIRSADLRVISIDSRTIRSPASGAINGARTSGREREYLHDHRRRATVSPARDRSRQRDYAHSVGRDGDSPSLSTAHNM